MIKFYGEKKEILPRHISLPSNSDPNKKLRHALCQLFEYGKKELFPSSSFFFNRDPTHNKKEEGVINSIY